MAYTRKSNFSREICSRRAYNVSVASMMETWVRDLRATRLHPLYEAFTAYHARGDIVPMPEIFADRERQRLSEYLNILV